MNETTAVFREQIHYGYPQNDYLWSLDRSPEYKYWCVCCAVLKFTLNLPKRPWCVRFHLSRKLNPDTAPLTPNLGVLYLPFLQSWVVAQAPKTCKYTQALGGSPVSLSNQVCSIFAQEHCKVWSPQKEQNQTCATQPISSCTSTWAGLVGCPGCFALFIFVPTASKVSLSNECQTYIEINSRPLSTKPKTKSTKTCKTRSSNMSLPRKLHSFSFSRGRAFAHTTKSARVVSPIFRVCFL